MIDRPLQFGVLCNGTSFAAWQAHAIRQLLENGNAQPALLIVDAKPKSVESAGARAARRLTRPKLFWRLFDAFSRPQSRVPIDLTRELEGVPVLRCATQPSGKFGEAFSGADVERIRAYDLDFILRFGFGILKGEILESARYGVWSFHHGDEQQYRGGPPAFWEIYHDDRATGAILQRLTERLDAGIVLRKGFIGTTIFSYAKNLSRLQFETASWPAYAVEALRRGVALPTEASNSQSPIRVAPTNAQMLAFFGVLLRNVARKTIAKFCRDEWNVGVVRQPVENLIAGNPVQHVEWHPRLTNGWIADPIAHANGKAVHVLCERMNLQTGKGTIVATSFDGKAWGNVDAAFDPGCHASYPYLLERDGEIYCIPEIGESNEVALYRAVRFPHEWEKTATLLRDFPGIDSTIFRHGEHWWLFCTQGGGGSHRLYAWYADDLFGPYRPHACNPIKIDVRGARPAGPLFVRGETLYRPAQDCSRTYGGRIVVNRVDELTPTSYAEEAVAYIEPERRGPYPSGLHTICAVGDICIIDGKRFALTVPR